MKRWTACGSRALVCTYAALLACALLSSRAGAHASPRVLDIMFQADGYVLLTNRGLIFGDKQRRQWRMMCIEALGINTTEQPSLIQLADGRLLSGTSHGLKATRDRGCTWDGVEPFASTAVPLLVVDPSDPKRVFLGAYAADASGRGGLHLSVDNGATWKSVMPTDGRDYLRSLLISPQDPTRLYASGQTWDDRGNYAYYVARSQDAGSHWERFPVALTDNELDLRLFAVSPRDAELIVGKAGGSAPASVPERLLVSRDGGRTFTSPLNTLLLSQAAFSADGSVAWVVGEQGLFESRDGLETFTRLGNAESLSYVVEHEGSLIACGLYEGYVAAMRSNGIGISSDGSARFDSFMQLRDASAPLDCDPSSMTAVTCAPWWADWQRELSASTGLPADASTGAGGDDSAQLPAAGNDGSPDASDAPDAGVRPAKRGAGGCQIGAERGRTAGGLFGFGLLWLAAWLWNRSSARRLNGVCPRSPACFCRNGITGSTRSG